MKSFHKKVASYFLIAIGLYGLSIPFINKPVLRIIVVMFLAFLPYKTLDLYKTSKENQYAREQLKTFLEQLCAKVSTGKALETVFLEARNDLLPIYGKKAILCVALKVFEDQMISGIVFDDAILSMVKIIPCQEAAPLFQTISKTRHLGNRILQVLRQSLYMVSELLLVTKDISSDVSQKRLESTIMSAMPFAVLWSLDLTTKSYLDPAFSKPLGALLMLSAFILAIAGYCTSCVIISRSIYNKKSNISSKQKGSITGLFSKIFISLIKTHPLRISVFKNLFKLFPEGYGLSLKRTLSYLYPSKENILEEYLFIKIALLLFCLILYFLLRFFIPIPFLFYLLITIFLLFLHDVDTKRLISRNKMQIMRDFPTFVGLLSTLLNNGIVLSKALFMCMDTFKNSCVPFQNELALLRGSINSGKPCYESLEDFANRCQIPEISCALLFAAQYDKTGSIENLNLLKLQCSNCWIQSKITARKQLEESSVQLLIPMMMQLICVMVITITPSIFSLQQIP